MSKHVSLASAAWAALILTAACARTDAPENGDVPATAEPAPASFAIRDVGFETPESVLYDEQADIYLVSNINGQAVERDDNGFIARVRPDGTVEALRWIDGARPHVTLHAPKGMALHGDTLFVSDIDTVRAFHRTSGAPLGVRGVRGAAFLNDLLVAPDGTLYVTDTGVDASFASVGKEAIYRFAQTGAEPVATGVELQGPNGLATDGTALYMVPFGGNTVTRRPLSGNEAARTVGTLPSGQLDGVQVLRDGSLLVASWEGKAVYRLAPDGAVTTIAEEVESPADIGWDARRNRVLIPLFTKNVIEIREVR